jgi:hypothetical protein
MRWKDNVAIYPTASEIVQALNDKGQQVKRKEKGREVMRTKYPLLEKLSLKIFTNVTKIIKPEGMDTNVTRGKKRVMTEILVLRKHIDINELDPFFHPYAKDGKVYTLGNSKVHCGLDMAIESFQKDVEANIAQKNSARTCNDGLRLAAIMLDGQYRSSVSLMLTKKKDRKQSDIAGDPALHFFEKVLSECFMNPSYVAPHPSDVYYNEFPEDERVNWDPNDPSIFENTRDAKWLKSTWEEYLRPKYKKALDRWNKDTGGGDGCPTNFVNFSAGDRWLVWVFCHDRDANFLLANSASGRMPRHLQLEGGFGEEPESSVSGSEADSARKRLRMENELDAISRDRNNLSRVVDKWTTMMETREKKEAAREKEEKEASIDERLRQVADYSRMLEDDKVLETMSPASSEVYKASLKKRRKDILNELSKQNN